MSIDAVREKLLSSLPPTPLQRIRSEAAERAGVELFLKRDDLIHPQISGNKWRKLKYNLLEALRQGQQALLTFGGAYSNHIYAVATAGKVYGFRTIGLIRGEEVLPLNPTLAFARSCGMELHYVSRQAYGLKDSAAFEQSLEKDFGSFYLLPEGGSNALAVKGVAELIAELDGQIRWDYLCCAAGTGGTLAGLVRGAGGKGQLIGFSSLKGGAFLRQEVDQFLGQYARLSGEKQSTYANWRIETDYHFGGYANTKPELLQFIRQFEKENNVLLEQVYTGKMLYGVEDLLRKGFFKAGTRLVAIHTGGLQGRLASL